MNALKEFNILEWIKLMQNAFPSDWEQARLDSSLRKEILDSCNKLTVSAYERKDRLALNDIHDILAVIYTMDFSSPNISNVDCDTQPIYRDISAHLERAMLQHEIKGINGALIASYPIKGEDYVKWLKRLISQDSSSVHSFYNSFLADRASSEDIVFYFAQETNLDPRFDDILAMMQVGAEIGQKLEIAKNYFDEMGNGEEIKVHSRMFNNALRALGVSDEFIKTNMLLEAKISGNISSCLSLSRRHYFKAIGYFGVTEYLAPRRFKHVVDAWRRNHLPLDGIAYHEAHIVIDTQHAKGWFDNVVVPLVNSNPKIGREIALGAVIRLASSGRYLDALLSHLESTRTKVSA